MKAIFVTRACKHMDHIGECLVLMNVGSDGSRHLAMANIDELSEKVLAQQFCDFKCSCSRKFASKIQSGVSTNNSAGQKYRPLLIVL